MSRAERALALLLRIEAAIVACALPAIVMPTSWMDAVHQALGMGELPRAPIVEYLTRTISMLYVAWAPLLWVMAGDLRRYLPLVWVFSWLNLIGGVVYPTLDVLVGMPISWTVSEGVTLLGFGVAMVLLARQVQREEQAIAARPPAG
jgi:hypothetical protein